MRLGRVTRDAQLVPNYLRRVIPHLQRSLRDARDRQSIRVHEGGDVADRKNLRMPGYGKIRLHQHAPSAITRRTEHFSERTSADARGPDDVTRTDRSIAHHDFSLANQAHAGVEQHLDAEFLELSLG